MSTLHQNTAACCLTCSSLFVRCVKRFVCYFVLCTPCPAKACPGCACAIQLRTNFCQSGTYVAGLMCCVCYAVLLNAVLSAADACLPPSDFPVVAIVRCPPSPRELVTPLLGNCICPNCKLYFSESKKYICPNLPLWQ